MPAPEEAFTITGGCNCGAVRYRVQVRKAVYPPRMLFHVPSVRPTDEKNILTATGICHCDSWRTGTGGIPASWGGHAGAGQRGSEPRRREDAPVVPVGRRSRRLAATQQIARGWASTA
ncbi:uncharacterized protein PgNI_00849 [Pyricularia grisea]|uniref:CENP-V/GFA domain-containing protein n=1 Tax=Pyricularia grisea TaxID=148305 RepID=A0A6P8BF65_PYRGI|nr:uncharacterized protein PgNI_00849 [Pyricularia grisea]TLD15428.1 hypothetical protein PgNI_00849 [Pyricularia grisea]